MSGAGTPRVERIAVEAESGTLRAAVLGTSRYLRRNPHVGAAETRVQLLTPQNPPVFPASPLEKRFHSFAQSGHFTSACASSSLRPPRQR